MSQTPPRGWLRLSGPALITGGLGILAVLALGAGGLAEPDVATWTAAALTVLVLAVVWRSARVVDPEGQPPQAPTRPPHENAPPYVSIINALPDPVLVIAAHEPDDLTGRRFVMVNDAARDLLRIQF
ncbi:MAG TPA: PAS domain-containing protein, partial [Phenylobacterium sp.]|nr:PAS domain-containing protein [Phenylobacterium sp.]